MLFRRRERFQELSLRIGNIFSFLSPNHWTFLTIITALITVYFLYMQNFLLAALLFAITAFVDFVDGSVARFAKKESKLGAYLDTIIDRYVEGIIILGLLFIQMPAILLPYYIWIFLYFLGSFMTTYSKSAAKEKELAKQEIKGGLLERAERMIILFIGILFATFDLIYLNYIIIILAVLSNITALQRVWIAIYSNR